MDAADRDLLVRFELALARRDPSLAGAPLASLLDPAFVEHGSSGRRWTREEVAAMVNGPTTEVMFADIDVGAVSEEVALVTYRSVDPAGGVTDAWRSSLWVRREGRWRIRFHQGTRLPGGT